MSKQVKIRRGTATQHASFTGVVGEITVDTTNYALRVHDGSTVGGKVMARADGTNASGTWGITASNVSGVVGVANGGTGASTLTGVVIGNGTSAFTVKTNPSGAFVGTTDTQTVTNKTLGNYTETVFAVVDGVGAVLNPNNGSIQTWTLGADRTPTQASWAQGQSITLMVNDTGSGFTVDWSTLGVVWVNGFAPSLLPTSGYTVMTLWKVGTTIYGSSAGQVA